MKAHLLKKVRDRTLLGARQVMLFSHSHCLGLSDPIMNVDYGVIHMYPVLKAGYICYTSLF